MQALSIILIIILTNNSKYSNEGPSLLHNYLFRLTNARNGYKDLEKVVLSPVVSCKAFN